MKVVLAHDFIRHGGAERVLEQMNILWPEAPIYTLLAERNPAYADWDIRPSRLQPWLPRARYRWGLPLYPFMVDRLRIPQDTELLISSSVSWMKSLKAPEGVPHLCYIHRPMMFAYERQGEFLAGYPAPVRPLLRALASRIRRWDQARADCPTLFLANSAHTARRVRELYRQDALVLHPPVKVEAFADAGSRTPVRDYFLTVLRLESYKRVDVVVEACTRMNLPLKVVGTGPELNKLRQLAGPTIQFPGFVDSAALPELVAGCRAFLFPAEEDFGIAPVEAMAAGRPVVAYGAAGCLETVRPGLCGLHFARQDAGCVMAALRQFQTMSFDSDRIREWARQFSEARFRRQFRRLALDLVAARGDGRKR